MKRMGPGERLARAAGAAALLTCGVAAPLAPWLRLIAFAVPGVYLLMTAVVGRCLADRLGGRSVAACRLEQRR